MPHVVIWGIEGSSRAGLGFGIHTAQHGLSVAHLRSEDKEGPWESLGMLYSECPGGLREGVPRQALIPSQRSLQVISLVAGFVNLS